MDALAALNRVLLKEKRYDDLARASSDAAYRQKLLEDLGIEGERLLLSAAGRTNAPR